MIQEPRGPQNRTKRSKSHCGRHQHRHAGGKNRLRGVLARNDWSPNPAQIVFTQWPAMHRGRARRRVPTGGDAASSADYPFIKGIARGRRDVVPLAWNEDASVRMPCEGASRGASRGIYIQPRFKIRWASRCRRRGARPAAGGRTTRLPSSKTPSTAFSTTKARWPRSHPIRASCSKPVEKWRRARARFIVAPPGAREHHGLVRSGGWTASGYAFAAGHG